MPLKDEFRLYLNGEPITSSKEDIDVVVRFQMNELPERRLESLRKATGEPWSVQGDGLVADSFPSAITGEVRVAKQSLHAGKSADLGRSHGFFIRVRDRLVNERDPLFGMNPLSYRTFNHFRADLEVNDLDVAVTAGREGVVASERQEKLQALLTELFYEARDRYEDMLKPAQDSEDRKRDGERNYVNPRLVEHPLADMLTMGGGTGGGAEADERPFYLAITPGTDVRALTRALYDPPHQSYIYKYTHAGRNDRLVQFDPAASTFYINADHDLVVAHASDDGTTKLLLEDVVTAEALLEVYLREHEVPAHTIGEVLERRDVLLRSLARDHLFSLAAIARTLREAAANEHDLEVALVTAARALGFVATHISGAGEPDGLARLTDYPAGETKITLEAKASSGTPQLGPIDFAGLEEHVRDQRYKAQGCLLIAPRYPGETRGDVSAAADRARSGLISCWTIEQLAQVVEAAESRHLTARHVLDIVLNKYAPEDVTEAVNRLLSQPAVATRDLYRAVLAALRNLEGRLPDRPRTTDMIAGEVSHEDAFKDVRGEEIEAAISALAQASQGLMHFRDGRVVVYGAYEEIERRLNGLIGQAGTPRGRGSFRAGTASGV